MIFHVFPGADLGLYEGWGPKPSQPGVNVCFPRSPQVKRSGKTWGGWGHAPPRKF